jgi:hypothetical protein
VSREEREERARAKHTHIHIQREREREARARTRLTKILSNASLTKVSKIHSRRIPLRLLACTLGKGGGNRFTMAARKDEEQDARTIIKEEKKMK